MNSSNPYQSPMDSIPANQHMAPAKKSAAIQVFGIMHLVFGILGILGALLTIVTSLIGNASMAGAGMIDPASMNALEDAKHWSLIDAGIKVVMGIILIFSGIKLLKFRFQGLRLSNAYSFLSIGHKAYALFLFLFVTWPIMQNMYANMPGMDENMAAIAQKGGMVGGVVVIILGLIYPILALILLNRDHVKASLN